MPDQLAFLPERVFTSAAMPGAGYRVEFFQSGTTTPVTVYTTAALSVAHPSPLVCDANGVFPAVFSTGGAIKAVITKPDGSSYYTLDPVFRVPTSASGATEITFAPTVALPFDNVQAAIEGAAASAASGFTPFGLGVTGTNALLANIDATNIASGAYRFDNTTTGTFPTGVTAANTGTVQLERENSGDAVMWLQSGSVDRAFFRRLASSTWGAWQEVILVPQGAASGDIIYRGASAWLRLGIGSAGQRIGVSSGAPAWLGGEGGPTTASGTSVSFSSIPATARKIIIFFNGVSFVGADNILIQIGTGGAAETTGYTGISARIDNATTATASITAGFLLTINGNLNAMSGMATLEKEPGSNTWHAASVTGNVALGLALHGSRKSLAGVLDFFRVIGDVGGTFDGGAISYRWEA